MVSVRHAGIVVEDLDKALHFYCDLLGLTLQRRMEESGGYIDNMLGLTDVRVTTVKLAGDEGETLLELLRFHNPPAETDRMVSVVSKGPTHVAFTVDDLDAVYEKLRSVGVQFNAPPQTSPDGFAKVTYCTDFEGNFCELVEQLMAVAPTSE